MRAPLHAWEYGAQALDCTGTSLRVRLTGFRLYVGRPGDLPYRTGKRPSDQCAHQRDSEDTAARHMCAAIAKPNAVCNIEEHHIAERADRSDARHTGPGSNSVAAGCDAACTELRGTSEPRFPYLTCAMNNSVSTSSVRLMHTTRRSATCRHANTARGRTGHVASSHGIVTAGTAINTSAFVAGKGTARASKVHGAQVDRLGALLLAAQLQWCILCLSLTHRMEHLCSTMP